MWDLIVIGGGTSGTVAAISAARGGAKTLLVERNSFLGGTMTGALVTPMMENFLPDGTQLQDGLYTEIINRLKQTGDCSDFKGRNPAWFNSEMLKCTLDDLCEESGVSVLFDTALVDAETDNSTIHHIKVHNKSGTSKLKARFYIDATGDADLASQAGVEWESGDNGKNQAMSLRFNMANIDTEKFAAWLLEIDPDSNITEVDYKKDGEILIHTAYTWDKGDWKLKPYFEQAIADGVLTTEDSAYFQVFSIPGQKGALSFNCPRIYSEKPLNPLDTKDISYAYTQGRKQIRRIAAFCKQYLVGFEHAYISQIAPNLGVRDSRRIKGKYRLNENDIISGKKVHYPCAKSNYPIDIHAYNKDQGTLKELNKNDYYEIPIESLMPEKIDNLLVIGRSICATFKAQASLRIQPNCISMGEHAGMYLSNKLKGNENE